MEWVPFPASVCTRSVYMCALVVIKKRQQTCLLLQLIQNIPKYTSSVNFMVNSILFIQNYQFYAAEKLGGMFLLELLYVYNF
jgi:hypothetical protein